jgi:tRNA A-37 threonylcarbamoyl transferase component Bud32
MEGPFKTDVIPLSDGRKLFLEKGSGWKDSFLEELLPALIYRKRPSDAEQIASSANSEVWKIPAEPSSLFIKFFIPRGVKDKLLIRKSRSRRAAEGGMLLIEKGFLAPECIAHADLVKHHCRTDSLIITREIKGSFDIYSFIENFFGQNPSQEEIQGKRDVIKAFAMLIGRLHRKGLFHGDLRPGNVLITRDENGPAFYFIDNERNRHFPKGLPARYRLKNLVQISMIVSPNITFTDRLRFFNAYIGENVNLIPFKKQWIHEVFLKTQKRLNKEMHGLWKKPALRK